MSRVDKGGRSFKPVGRPAQPKRPLIAPPRTGGPSLTPSQPPEPTPARATSPPSTTTQPTQQFAVPLVPQRDVHASRAPSEQARGISIAPEDFFSYDVVTRGQRPPTVVEEAPLATAQDVEEGGQQQEDGRAAALQSAKSKMAAKAKAARAGRQGRRSLSILSGRTTTPAPEPTQSQDGPPAASGSGGNRSMVVDPDLVGPDEREANAAAIDAVLAASRRLPLNQVVERPEEEEEDIPVVDQGPASSQQPAAAVTRKRRGRPRSLKSKGKRKAQQEDALQGEDSEDISPRLKRQRARSKKVQRTEQGDISVSAEQGEDEEVAATPRKRRSGPKFLKRSRGPSSTPANGTGPAQDAVDEHDEVSSGSEIDPAQTTLMDICADPGRGKTSESLDQRMVLVRERRTREEQERKEMRAKWIREEKKIANGIGVPEEEEEEDEEAQAEAKAQGEDEVEGQADGEEAGGGREDVEEEEEEEAGKGARQTRSMTKQKQRQVDDDEELPDVEAALDGTAGELNGHVEEEEQQPHEDGEEDRDEEEEGVQPVNANAPQMRMVNGQMVLDESSLQVDHSALGANLDEMEEIVEHDEARLVNSATWGKRIRGDRWTPDDTVLFYDGLRMFGTDFEMIAQLFPSRTRKQIKLKFNREERLDPKTVTDAIMGRTDKREVDVVAYGKRVGVDMSGPCPDDPMEKWRKAELEAPVANGGGEEGQEVEEQGEGEEEQQLLEAAADQVDAEERQWGEPGLFADEDV